MAPKSNLGKLGAIFSAVLVLICMGGAGYMVLAAVGTLNCYTKELDVAKPDTLLLGSALAANELPWYGDQSANEPGRIYGANAVGTKREMLPAVFAPVQSRDAKDLGVGKLLVASPIPAVNALLQSAAKVEGTNQILKEVYLISTKTLLEQTLAVRPDPQVFMFIWAMRDGRAINYGRKWNWARGSSSPRTVARFSIRIRVRCGRR